ncbi:unnamed protein product [Amaranthus hypochondriacus]
MKPCTGQEEGILKPPAASAHPPPIQNPDASQPVDVEPQASNPPSEVLVQHFNSQPSTDVAQLQLPHLVLRQEHVLPMALECLVWNTVKILIM